MKIENGYNRYLQSIKQTQQHTPSKKAEQKSETKQEETVQVNISEEAKRLSEVSQKGAHSQRAEEIKQAIQNNTYEVSPEQISKGLMQALRNQKGNE